ncbi:MAG TPA: hypothetical protein VFQ51_06865 [Vicinamibacteria bacterium]|nr:hypothetical protein [Vicinamibacteria bacterium]
MTKPARRPLLQLGELDVELLGAKASDLLLGRFDAAAVRRELQESGLIEALAERGYPELEIAIRAIAGEHRLAVRARRGRVALVDLRLAEASSPVDEPLARAHGLPVLSVLSVLWLALQHPKGRFTRERPRLPGQRFPGLGLSKPVVLRLLHWARAWGKDALVAIPQYYHNAVFYSPIFRFLSPGRQGAFEALRRDLARLPLARASAAVEAGCVVCEPSGEPFAWTAGELLVPLTRPLAAHFDSTDYARAVAESREACRYRFSPPQASHGHRARSSRKL